MQLQGYWCRARSVQWNGTMSILIFVLRAEDFQKLKMRVKNTLCFISFPEQSAKFVISQQVKMSLRLHEINIVAKLSIYVLNTTKVCVKNGFAKMTRHFQL